MQSTKQSNDQLRQVVSAGINHCRPVDEPRRAYITKCRADLATLDQINEEAEQAANRG